MVKQHKMYINGEFVPALDGRTLAVYNPATEKAISEVPRGGADDAKIAINAAEAAKKLGNVYQRLNEENIYVKLLWGFVSVPMKLLALFPKKWVKLCP